MNKSFEDFKKSCIESNNLLVVHYSNEVLLNPLTTEQMVAMWNSAHQNSYIHMERLTVSELKAKYGFDFGPVV